MAKDKIFVVHKHAATHLHYDLRLEIDGILKSWAVPKGPSTNPSDKRLAVLVEDHELEYANFQGTIPEGMYGAGKVEIYDKGTYELIKNETDKIEFELKGKKLKGIWVLIRMKGQQKNWLLIKKAE